MLCRKELGTRHVAWMWDLDPGAWLLDLAQFTTSCGALGPTDALSLDFLPWKTGIRGLTALWGGSNEMMAKVLSTKPAPGGPVSISCPAGVGTKGGPSAHGGEKSKAQKAGQATGSRETPAERWTAAHGHHPPQGRQPRSLQLLPRAELETWAHETLTEGQEAAPVNYQAEAATSGSLCRRKYSRTYREGFSGNPEKPRGPWSPRRYLEVKVRLHPPRMGKFQRPQPGGRHPARLSNPLIPAHNPCPHTQPSDTSS